jgi:hypothetical protein
MIFFIGFWFKGINKKPVLPVYARRMGSLLNIQTLPLTGEPADKEQYFRPKKP